MLLAEEVTYNIHIFLLRNVDSTCTANAESGWSPGF